MDKNSHITTLPQAPKQSKRDILASLLLAAGLIVTPAFTPSSNAHHLSEGRAIIEQPKDMATKDEFLMPYDYRVIPNLRTHLISFKSKNELGEDTFRTITNTYILAVKSKDKRRVGNVFVGYNANSKLVKVTPEGEVLSRNTMDSVGKGLNSDRHLLSQILQKDRKLQPVEKQIFKQNTTSTLYGVLLLSQRLRGLQSMYIGDKKVASAREIYVLQGLRRFQNSSLYKDFTTDIKREVQYDIYVIYRRIMRRVHIALGFTVNYNEVDYFKSTILARRRHYRFRRDREYAKYKRIKKNLLRQLRADRVIQSRGVARKAPFPIVGEDIMNQPLQNNQGGDRRYSLPKKRKPGEYKSSEKRKSYTKYSLPQKRKLGTKYTLPSNR